MLDLPWQSADNDSRFSILMFMGALGITLPFSQQRMTLSGFVTLETATNLVVQVGLSTGIDGLDSMLAQTDRMTSGPFSLSWKAPVPPPNSGLNYIQINVGSLNYYGPFQTAGTVTTCAWQLCYGDPLLDVTGIINAGTGTFDYLKVNHFDAPS